MRLFLSVFVCMLFASVAQAAPSHGLTLYGTLKYPATFAHFDYVNPDAPKGGRLRLAELGTFDNLNPFILQGVKAPGTPLVFESLMHRSLDEPQSVYGLLAESIDVAADHKSATFVLRKEVKWHDGTPVTPDDVVFTFHTLKAKGDPTYRILLKEVSGIEKSGPRSVTFTFSNAQNRELPLLVAEIPIFSKAYYTAHDFAKTSLEPPMGSGPYHIVKVEPGRRLIYERVTDYWGRNLPINLGTYNFDRIRYDLYRDETVALQALKAHEYDFREEYISKAWATSYDGPAVQDGRLVKQLFPDQNPKGMQGFVMNLRRPQLADPRVRQALDLCLDFEWMNKTLFYGVYQRNYSFFGKTPFEAVKPADAAERALWATVTGAPAGIADFVYQPPKTDGSGNNRDQLKEANRLLNEAGWTIKDDLRVNAKGEPLKVEFLLHQATFERVAAPIVSNLKRLGVQATIRLVDEAQYQKRMEQYDFDIISFWYHRGLFLPGNEQIAEWQSSQADVTGGNNLPGLKDPAVDQVLAVLTTAKDEPALTAAGRALDRLLLWHRLVIPHWYIEHFRLAYWDTFGKPKITPPYDPGVLTWWIDGEKAKRLEEKRK